MSRLKGGGLEDLRSGSTVAARALAQRFHQGYRNLVLLIDGCRAAPAVIDIAPATSVGTVMRARLRAEPQVADVISYSYWSTRAAAPSLRDGDLPKRDRSAARKSG